MFSKEGITEDCNHLIVLSTIEKLNNDGNIANRRAIMDHAKLFSPYLDGIITFLLDEQYVERESDWNRHDTYSYGLTQNGRNMLERNRLKATNFANCLIALCKTNQKELLYKSVTENRESLWFAHFEGFLNEEELMNITQLLRLGTRHFLWDQSIQKVVDVAWPSYKLW